MIITIQIDSSHMNDGEQQVLDFILKNNMKDAADRYNRSQKYEVGLEAGSTKQSADKEEISELTEKVKKQDNEIAKSNEKIQSLEKENDDYKTKIRNCETEINELKKQLERYSVDSSEKFYFEVERGHLEETTSNCALYWASKTGEHCNYSINIEKGPIKDALKNKGLYLDPYCEIDDNNVNDANFIEVINEGTAKYHGNGLEVVKKVKIKLIKQ